MNKLFLIGNLTKAPEGGKANDKTYAKLNIAINSYKQGEERHVEYFNVSVYGVQAENCLKWLEKGSKVAIVAQLRNRTYDDKDGIKRYVVDIIANEVEFMSKKQGNEGSSAELEPIDEKDLPF